MWRIRSLAFGNGFVTFSTEVIQPLDIISSCAWILKLLSSDRYNTDVLSLREAICTFSVNAAESISPFMINGSALNTAAIMNKILRVQYPINIRYTLPSYESNAHVYKCL